MRCFDPRRHDLHFALPDPAGDVGNLNSRESNGSDSPQGQRVRRGAGSELVNQGLVLLSQPMTDKPCSADHRDRISRKTFA